MQRILIVGGGFAGVWSALSAARLRDQAGVAPTDLEITVIAPEPFLDMRPRLYEEGAAGMVAPLADLFTATDVGFIAGRVKQIRADKGSVEVQTAQGVRETLDFDRLILASGSRLYRPAIPGLEKAFSIDQRDEAAVFEQHLHELAYLPSTPARNTAIIVGGGFTGLELATELPARMRSILGKDAPVRVIVIEREADIGPELGAGPRPVILEALNSLGVECMLSTSITAMDETSVTLTTGEKIETLSVVWTGGMRASALAEQIEAPRDDLGRLHVDANLRVKGNYAIFATGDMAFAATDDLGNHALMSCQHALSLGRAAGNNAAADLLGLELRPYRQEQYVTCLDLGPWGAVVTEGWDRKIQTSGKEAKKLKHFINTVVIAPPRANREEAFRRADPAAAIAPDVTT